MAAYEGYVYHHYPAMIYNDKLINGKKIVNNLEEENEVRNYGQAIVEVPNAAVENFHEIPETVVSRESVSEEPVRPAEPARKKRGRKSQIEKIAALTPEKIHELLNS